MNKKKVAFLIYSLESGGAERVLTTLANNFTNIYEVHIITIINSEIFYKINKSIKMHHCRENEVKKSNFLSSIKSNYILFRKVKNILKYEQIDLLIGFMTTSNVIASFAANTVNIPCIISERTNPYFDKPNFIWRNLVSLSFPKADYIVVQSKMVKSYYEKFIPFNKIVILQNPISSELSCLKNMSSERENVILNVGRLVSSKNQDLLIKAFSNLNNQKWKLIFIGDGPLLSNYKALVNELNQKGKIIFVGKTNDVAKYYNTSKIFAFTSKYEGFPNALIEAMFFELACISTDCPSGPAELINHTENGYLIPVGNQNQLEIYLKKLMNDEALRDVIGKNAYESVSNFEEKLVADKWNELVKKLLIV